MEKVAFEITLTDAVDVFNRTRPGTRVETFAIVRKDEKGVDEIQHPLFPNMRTQLDPAASEPLLHIVMRDGDRVSQRLPVDQIAAYAKGRIEMLPSEFRRFENPHIYRVGISEKLAELRRDLVAQARSRMQQT